VPRKLPVVIAASAAVLATASPALAAPGGGDKPFRLRHSTQVVDPTGVVCGTEYPTPYRAVGTGNLSHLGRVSLDLEACNTGLGPVGTAVGTATYTAANGDVLEIAFQGSYVVEFDVASQTATSVLTADAIPGATSGTGRFAHAEVNGQLIQTDVTSLSTGATTGTGQGSGTIAYFASDRAAG
jgi:hypothetical protein